MLQQAFFLPRFRHEEIWRTCATIIAASSMPVALRRIARVYMRHETITVDKVARPTLRPIMVPTFDCESSSGFSVIFSAEIDNAESEKEKQRKAKLMGLPRDPRSGLLDRFNTWGRGWQHGSTAGICHFKEQLIGPRLAYQRPETKALVSWARYR